MQLPQRLGWDGVLKESAYDDLKNAQAHLNSGLLTNILQTVGDLQKSSALGQCQVESSLKLQNMLKHPLEKNVVKSKNLYAQLTRKSVDLLANQQMQDKKSQMASHFAKMKRMKTIFCHADHSTDEVSSVFNIQFDKTGQFIVSGADDGILKVWDRNTLQLQASLHGHCDYIVDIEVSKCNRFIASASKDTTVVVWDLKMGKLLARFNDHNQQVNRVIFVSPKGGASTAQPSNSNSWTSKQEFLNSIQKMSSRKDRSIGESSDSFGPKNRIVQTQFLLTASDDGTVMLYDFSPYSQTSRESNHSQSKEEIDQFRVRRSTRHPGDSRSGGRNTESQEEKEMHFFKVTLTPDDFRPGTRNKKLDTVDCSSNGVVIAGSNTGEMHVWKLHFNEIANQNKNQAYTYLGTFKICKNARIQFAQFSPAADLLMTGTTDGMVKIWKLDFPSNKQQEKIAIKSFTLNDLSRVLLQIDEKNGCQKTESIEFLDENGENQVDFKSVNVPSMSIIGFGKVKELNYLQSQVDAIAWSKHGRYAVASITSQLPPDILTAELREDYKEEICKIKIWDTVNETFFDDLARPSGCQIKKNSWVLAPHPIIEELLMTGSDGGTLILWNIETKQMLQRFYQNGVYSIDALTMDNPLDGKFSPDGNAFACGNQLGTISLYSCENVEHQYEATRVQQFMLFDRSRNTNNPFQRVENKPQICAYNMIPYEVQPEPLIGKFANEKDHDEGELEKDQVEKQIKSLNVLKEESKAFQRKQTLAKELGIMEEKYYQDQLKACLEENELIPDILVDGGLQLDEMDDMSMNYDMPNDRLQDVSMNMANGFSGSPIRAVSQNARRPQQDNQNQFNRQDARSIVRQQALQSPERRRVGQMTQRAQRRLRRVNDRSMRDRPETNGFETDMIEDGYTENENDQASDFQESDANMESDDSEESDLDDESEDRIVRSTFVVRRTNMHEAQRNRYQERASNDRANRLARRTQTRSPEEPEQVRRHVGGRLHRNIPRQPIAESLVNEDSLVSDRIDLPMRRGRGRPSRREAEERQRLIDQQQSSQSQNNQNQGASTRPQRGRDNRRRVVEDSSDAGTSQRISQERDQNQRNGRLARAGRRANGSTRNLDIEESKYGDKNQSQNDFIRQNGFYLSDREVEIANEFENATLNEKDEDSSEEVEKKKGKKVMLKNTDGNPDKDYILVSDTSTLGPDALKDIKRVCTLCTRIDEPLVGPFCKWDKNKNLVGSPLYFHSECIEKSTYSWYDTEERTWINIGKALQQLVHKNKYICYRCNLEGASLQCYQCQHTFHGYKCSGIYTIELQQPDLDGTFYQCVFCRNTENYETYTQTKVTKPKHGFVRDEHYLRSIEKINKDHLLTAKNYEQLMKSDPFASYNPQVNDMVYYFFQGHETFVSQYSCTYFSGVSQRVSRRRWMPWIKQKNLRKREFVLCKVDKIHVLFPSERSVKLMEEYSTCTEVKQTPQLIQRLTLSVQQQTQSSLRQQSQQNSVMFQVDMFPNALADFLIPQAVFEKKYELYMNAVNGNQFVGKSFKVNSKQLTNRSNQMQMVKIVRDNVPLEPSLYPQSLWQNILCIPATETRRGGYGTVSEMPQHRSTRNDAQSTDYSLEDCIRVSFWEILFGDEIAEISRNSQVFQADERAKLCNVFQDFMVKKSEYVVPFRERVLLELAEDYRTIISAEMYFNLIGERLQNGFYRSQEQLLFDIDLISHNARVYNGEGHDIAESAKELCEVVRLQLKKNMFTRGDKILQQQLQNAGKLTVPSRNRNSLQQRSMLDELRNQIGSESKLRGRDLIDIEEVKGDNTKKPNGFPIQALPSQIEILSDNEDKEVKLIDTNQLTYGTIKSLESKFANMPVLWLNNEFKAMSAAEKSEISNSSTMGRRRTRRQAGLAPTEELEQSMGASSSGATHQKASLTPGQSSLMVGTNTGEESQRLTRLRKRQKIE